MYKVAAYNEAPEGPIEILRLESAATKREAMAVLDIMRAAYGRIAREEKVLSEESVVSQFETSTQNIQRQEKGMQRYSNTQLSNYYFAFVDEEYYRPVGLAKVSPSRSIWGKLIMNVPNCFLKDIAVATDGKGIGSALHHAVLDRHIFSEKGPVILDAIKGNDRANGWFKALGYIATRAYVEPLPIGGETVEQVRMQAPSLWSVRIRLEAKHPWLAAAQPEN